MRWLGPDIARAQAAGAGAPTVLSAGAGAPGDNLGGRISLSESDCALFLARGSSSVEDLDLFVYGDDGTLLGGDETSSASASALVCPPHPARVYAFGRIAAGRGLFAVSAQTARPSDSDRVARAVGAAGKLHEEALAASGWPGLEEALSAHRRAVGGTFRDARRVAVPRDPRIPTRVSAVVEPGQCVDVLVLPSDEVAYVELAVLDVDGRIIGRAPSEQRLPSLLACAALRADVTFELRPHAGRGLAAVVTSTTDDVKALEAASTVVVLDALPRGVALDDGAVLAQRLTHAGYPPPLAVGRGSTGVGRRVSLSIDIPEGCSRFDVVAAAPARGVDAWLWAPTGSLVAHADGAAVATLFACGKSPRARLDVEALTRAGSFTVERRTVWTSVPLLPQHPLAAGRLLARLVAADRIIPGRTLEPRAFLLTPTQLTTEEMSVPPGQCLDVAMALGEGAEGAELRLVDVDAGDQVSLMRGTYSAFAEACALDRASPLRLRLEMHAVAGSTVSLLSTHLRVPEKPKPSASP